MGREVQPRDESPKPPTYADAMSWHTLAVQAFIKAENSTDASRQPIEYARAAAAAAIAQSAASMRLIAPVNITVQP